MYAHRGPCSMRRQRQYSSSPQLHFTVSPLLPLAPCPLPPMPTSPPLSCLMPTYPPSAWPLPPAPATAPLARTCPLCLPTCPPGHPCPTSLPRWPTSKSCSRKARWLSLWGASLRCEGEGWEVEARGPSGGGGTGSPGASRHATQHTHVPLRPHQPYCCLLRRTGSAVGRLGLGPRA